MFFEIAIVLALIVLNGALAMSELAVVSSRPARLKAMAENKRRGARAALVLAEDPGRFLSTVQIGITLVGVLSGAFSGATLGPRFAAALLRMGVPADWATPLGVGSVVVMLTYLSLIVGELVPKQIALRDPEGTAAQIMTWPASPARDTALDSSPEYIQARPDARRAAWRQSRTLRVLLRHRD